MLVARIIRSLANVVVSTDELGRTTSYVYDELDRQTSVTNTLGDTATTKYDRLLSFSLSRTEVTLSARLNYICHF